jgi:hypothetical protein
LLSALLVVVASQLSLPPATACSRVTS